MPLPPSWSQVPVTYDPITFTGRKLTGSVVFVPPRPVYVAGVLVVPEQIELVLDENGLLSGFLPSTNDPDITPNPWTYQVIEKTRPYRRDPYAISVPYDSPGIDLATVVPAVPVDPTATYLAQTDIGVSVASQSAVEAAQADATQALQDAAAAQGTADAAASYVQMLAEARGAANGVTPLNADTRVDPMYRAKKIASATPSAGALTLDLSAADDFYVSLTASVTSTAFTNAPPTGYVREGTLIFVQAGSGGYTWTPPAGSKWPNGLAAVLTSAVGSVDHIGYRVDNRNGTPAYSFYPVRDVK